MMARIVPSVIPTATCPTTRLSPAAAIATVLLLMARPAVADSIAVNFIGGCWSCMEDGALVNGETGIILQSNWNNVAPWSNGMSQGGGEPPDETGTASNLLDDSGAETTADISWSADNTFAAFNANNGNEASNLMDGYIDVSGESPRTTTTVSQIPYETYDVFVYVGSDGNDRSGFVDVNDDPSTAIWFLTDTGPGRFNGPGDFRQATATSEAEAIRSNYILYQSLQGDELTVAVNGGSSNAGIHGLQIVEAFNLTMLVDRTSGGVELVNDTVADFDIDFYELRSIGGALNPGGFVSLEEQDFEQNGDPGTGEGWEELGDGSANTLAEAYLQGSSIISSGTTIPLGQAFTPAGSEDLVFSWHAADTGVTKQGIVNYCDGCIEVQPQLPADFDKDGDVDGDDFLTWQTGFGTTTGATQADGDADGDGDVDGDDFLKWQTDFGSGGGDGLGVGAIPEPGTMLLLAFQVCTLSLIGRRGYVAAQPRSGSISRR